MDLRGEKGKELGRLCWERGAEEFAAACQEPSALWIPPGIWEPPSHLFPALLPPPQSVPQFPHQSWEVLGWVGRASGVPTCPWGGVSVCLGGVLMGSAPTPTPPGGGFILPPGFPLELELWG